MSVHFERGKNRFIWIFIVTFLQLFLTRVHLTGFICFKDFFLFAIYMEMVSFFTPFSSATLFFVIYSLFSFLQSFISFCCRNVYSFHLSHLFGRTSLFMEDANFVILNIRILIRSNFSEVSQRRHCIADIRKKCFTGFGTKFGKEK